MGGRTCSSGCPEPEPAGSWLSRWGWWAWGILTWPATVRELKRHGFRRTGFMTWDTGPASEDESG
jgi:hypothetical protein